MNITAYLSERKRQVDSSSRKIKDRAVFDFHFIPDEPLMREEADKLLEAMIQFEVTGLPDHHAIIGSRGSGKTLTMKWIQKVIPANTELDVVYANCREHNTSFKIFAHLLDVQARGASLSELYERFCKTSGPKTVVVLDEIDLMSIKDKRREILYLLSRSEKPFMVVMLSNTPQVLKEIDPATRSTARRGTGRFRRLILRAICQSGRGLLLHPGSRRKEKTPRPNRGTD